VTFAGRSDGGKMVAFSFNKFILYSSEVTKALGLIPRALFLGEMRNISPVSFEL
jgi:hypothetical protein